MKQIAKKISEARKNKGLTQEELAEQSQINLRTIQRIENSENETRGKTLKLICDVLQIDVNELLPHKNYLIKNTIGTKIINGFFLIVLNLILIGIIGFLTLGAKGNINSLFGGVLLSFFIPFFIVFFTEKMSGMERMLKFGFGYIYYIAYIWILNGFPTGFKTGLFPCLFISLSVLYFGSELLKKRK